MLSRSLVEADRPRSTEINVYIVGLKDDRFDYVSTDPVQSLELLAGLISHDEK